MTSKEMRKLIESVEMVEEVIEVGRLDEIKNEIKELMNEARSILQHGDERTWARAKGYWYAHIVSALDKEHDYMGNSMVTMQDTIDEMGGGGSMEDAVSQVNDYMNEIGVNDVEEAVGVVADETGVNYNELMAAVRQAIG